MLIDPQSASDWSLAVEAYRTIAPEGFAIPSFSLGANFTSQFIAVTVTANNQKSTWNAGGYLSQIYNFPSFSLTGHAYFVGINRQNLIKLQKLAPGAFDLVYSPPDYFEDVRIRVWEYVGATIFDTINNVEDVVEAIENLNLSSQISFLRSLIEEKTEDLTADNVTLIAELNLLKTELLQQLYEIDAGIYSLAEGIGALLPEEAANQLSSTTQRRLNLIPGML